MLLETAPPNSNRIPDGTFSGRIYGHFYTFQCVYHHFAQGIC